MTKNTKKRAESQKKQAKNGRFSPNAHLNGRLSNLYLYLYPHDYLSSPGHPDPGHRPAAHPPTQVNHSNNNLQHKYIFLNFTKVSQPSVSDTITGFFLQISGPSVQLPPTPPHGSWTCFCSYSWTASCVHWWISCFSCSYASCALSSPRQRRTKRRCQGPGGGTWSARNEDLMQKKKRKISTKKEI